MWGGVAILAAVGFLTRNTAGCGSWQEGLLIRGYASDHLRGPRDAPDPESFEYASDAAQHSGLPVGWTLTLLERGTSPQELREVAIRLRRRLDALPPPQDAEPQTLAAYREHLLALESP